MNKINVSQIQSSSKSHLKQTKLTLSTKKIRSRMQIGLSPSSRSITQSSKHINKSSKQYLQNTIENNLIQSKILSQKNANGNYTLLSKSNFHLPNQKFQLGKLKIAVIKVDAKKALTEDQFFYHISNTPANLNDPKAGTILDNLKRLKQAKQHQYDRCLHLKSSRHQKPQFVRLKTQKQIRQELSKQISKPYKFQFNVNKDRNVNEVKVNMFNFLDGISNTKQVQNDSLKYKKFNPIQSKLKNCSWSQNKIK